MLRDEPVLIKLFLIRSTMQLSVIIVSYNVKYVLEQCLHALFNSLNNINTEIIVIDNASEDGSINYLHAKFPQVIFIKNKINTGFAKANNQALMIAKGEYILYLNPDVIVSEETIINCLLFLKEQKNAGAVSVRMIDGDGSFLAESKRTFPSVAASFFKLSGLAALFPHSSKFNKYGLGNLEEDGIYEADVLCGAFMMCNKNILTLLNGFDEDFFMYGEDIDLSYRIQKSGYKNYYLGNNVIIHFKGKSTEKNKPEYKKNFYGAMKIFVEKHYKNKSSFLLKAAISTTGLISFYSKKIKRSLTSDKKTKDHNFILLGSKEAVESAAAILSLNNCRFQKIITDDSTSSIAFEAIKQVGLKSGIVFCTGNLMYSECIQFIQDNKNSCVYYWHFLNSRSIVTGSKKAGIHQIYVSI